jgi:hypothetical protein
MNAGTNCYCYYTASASLLASKELATSFDANARFCYITGAVELRYTCRKRLLWCVVEAAKERLADNAANAATGTGALDKQRETDEAENACTADPSISGTTQEFSA